MTKRWSDIKAERPVSAQAREQAHIDNLAEDFGLALAQLRRGEQLTQVEIAHRLLVTQPTVSEIERTDSPSVPTVRRYVEAVGAKLELVAVFADGRRVALDTRAPQETQLSNKTPGRTATKKLASETPTKRAKASAGIAPGQQQNRTKKK